MLSSGRTVDPSDAIRRLFTALGEGDVEAVGSSYVDAALCASWDSSTSEGTSWLATPCDGADATLTWAGSSPRIINCVYGRGGCYVEGCFTDQRERTARTFVASFQFAGDCAIKRQLSFRGPFIPPCPVSHADEAEPPGDGRLVAEQYFAALARGDLDHAAGFFSENCLYAHLPFSFGTQTTVFRGRDEVLAAFNRRGVQPWRSSIDVSVQHGAECFIEGVVRGTPKSGSYVSSLSLDREGLIRRYVAFFCEPPVPRR